MSERITHDDVRADAAGHPLIGRIGDGTDGIYVGRFAAADFGNPFKISRSVSRDQVVERYRAWLKEQIREDPDRWVPMLAALFNERLICHCAPNRCHAEVLVKASIWAWSEMGMPEHELAKELRESEADAKAAAERAPGPLAAAPHRAMARTAGALAEEAEKR